jgi:carbon storage regulator
MLVLSRRKDESIMVGDDVEIMIVAIRRNEIRLGINAPKFIPVHRKEVYGRILRERNARNNERSLSFHHSLSNAIAVGT